MTDTLVSVTIQEDPMPVFIDTGTPQVTITDNSNTVTVIEASPVYVATADNTATVLINYGGYGGSVGLAALLSDLTGHLTIDQMNPDLASDLTRLESLWNRVGNELILSYPDGVAIQEAGRAYTDSSITDIVADINVSVDGKIDAAYSYIEQTASSIDQRIVSMEGDVDSRFVVAESRIFQTESSITSTVSRLDTIDGPGGSVELLQSSIDQQADSITLEVAARQLVEGNLLIAQSNIALLTDSITLMTSSIDTLNNQMTETSIILGTDGINLTVLQESLSQHEYSISTMQTMLTNQWGVTIEEDVYGNKYSTGFGLILHPTWLIGEYYSVGFIVLYDDVIYECLIAHTSSTANTPAESSTYWSELPDGVRSVFTVKADSFKVLTASGPATIFEVTGDSISLNANVTVTGTLVIGPGSTGYSNIADAPLSLNDLDETAYTDLQQASTNALQALSNAATAQSTADGKIMTFYQPGAPVSGMDIGDFWVDTDDNDKVYIYSGSAWIVAQNNLIANAVNLAQTAQSTADGKAVVFYSSTIPSGATTGDLWYDTDDAQKRLYRYNGSAWVTVASYGATWGTSIYNQPTSLADLNATEYSNLTTALTDAAQAIQDAASAQSTADGKITSFYQTTAPTNGMDTGDFWIDTDDGNKMYRYSGTSWVVVQDDAIGTAINAAQTAQTTADGKAIVFYQTNPPSDATTGDLWYDTDDAQKRVYRRSSSATWDVIASYGAAWGTNIINEPTSLADINLIEYGFLPTAAVGELAYEDLVEVAKLGNTIISGGYIKTELIQANALVVGSIIGQGDLATKDRSDLSYTDGADVTAQNLYVPYITWEFRGTSDGFTPYNLTVTNNSDSVLLTPTGNDPKWVKTHLSIDGSIYNIIQIRIKRVSGVSWQGSIYYWTANHGETEAYVYRIPASSVSTSYQTIVCDMSALTYGGDDWITSTINAIRFDFSSNSTSVFEVDWISIGKRGVDPLLEGGVEKGATANNTYFQNTAPVGTKGDIWLDTDDNQLYTHNGSAWIAGKSGTDGMDGEDGNSIIWKGSFATSPLNPVELWAYYNTTDKKSYVYSDNTWYQMSVDGTPGTPGTSIAWKGSSASPPASPQLNWAYYDTDNGIAYIYNGTGWEVLAQDGLDGIDGLDGTTYYTWLKYADSPTSGMSDSPTGKIYMGLAYNKTDPTESTNYSDYNWSLIKGDTGGMGIPGTSYFVWIKYADDSSGTNMSDYPSGKKYIGLAHNKTTATESSIASDYTWSLIQGPQGIQGIQGPQGIAGTGINDVVNYYAINNSATVAPTSWSTTVQTPTSVNKYLWNYERINYSSGSYADTSPAVIGMYSANGVNGVGVSSITEEYALSTSSSSVTGSWSSSVPTLTTTNKYLWNKETINYTDNTSVTTAAVVIGVYGNTGADGNSIEFIFKRQTTSTAPATPATSQTDDYIPSGWTDNPTGVNSTYKYEFSCMRTKTAGVWSAFSTPGLWATYGADGTSTFTYYQEATPVGAKVNELWYSPATRFLRRCGVASSTNINDWPLVANGFDNTNMLTDGALLGEKAIWTSVTGRPTSLANINSAEYSRLPTSTVKALAYLDKVGNDQITTISGGKISTGVIYGNSNYSYWDLNNNKMYFTGTSNIEFASTAYLKFGDLASIKGPGSETIYFTSGQLTLSSGTGSYLQLWNTYAKLITDEDLFFEAANDIFITAGSSYKTYFKFGSTNKIQINQYGMRPVTSNNMLLGDSGYYWASCYATTYYDNGGGYQDLQDDLSVMAEFKPRKNIIIDPETREKTISQHTEINPNTGLEYLDLLSIPRWMTNYDSVVEKLKSENGDLLSNEDIEELLEDYHEAGWLLCRNISAFNDCTSGGVRQLDIEMKELYELMANRITVLENKIKNKEIV